MATVDMVFKFKGVASIDEVAENAEYSLAHPFIENQEIVESDVEANTITVRCWLFDVVIDDNGCSLSDSVMPVNEEIIETVKDLVDDNGVLSKEDTIQAVSSEMYYYFFTDEKETVEYDAELVELLPL